MLRLPGEGEEAPPLMREKRKYGSIAAPAGTMGQSSIPEGFKPRQSSRHRRHQDVPEWEVGSQDVEYSDANVSAGRWWVLVGLSGVGVLALVLFLALRPQSKVAPVAVQGDEPPVPKENVVPQEVTVPTLAPKVEEPAPDAGKAPTLALDGKDFAERGQQIASKFVEAKSVDELLPLIRGGESMRVIVTAYHKEHPLQQETLRKFAENGSYSQVENMFYTNIGLSDFSSRAIAFERTADGQYLIDWESWVGWCESEWDAYREQRPTKPQIFRVKLKTLDYYNFAFQDERKWRSFRLASADDESSLYGYVERDSKVEGDLLQTMKGTAGANVIVRLMYPDKAQSADQVIITEVLQDGWSSPNVPVTNAK